MKASVKRPKGNRKHPVFLYFFSLLYLLGLTGGLLIVNGSGAGQAIASLEETAPLEYEITFMDKTWTASLGPLNRAAGFLKENSFLLPPPVHLLSQAAAVLRLAFTDPELLWELVFRREPEEARTFEKEAVLLPGAKNCLRAARFMV